MPLEFFEKCDEDAWLYSRIAKLENALKILRDKPPDGIIIGKAAYDIWKNHIIDEALKEEE